MTGLLARITGYPPGAQSQITERVERE